MMNIFDIRKDRCHVCGLKMQKTKDLQTDETVYICRNCYSSFFNGHPVYDKNGNAIGVCKWIENTPFTLQKKSS